MSSPHADADDTIVTAGTNTLQLADNEMTQEIVDHIKMVGKKMVALVPPGEQVSFFIPVFVKVAGKSRPGGLLYTSSTPTNT
jgi:hypothetical protein